MLVRLLFVTSVHSHSTHVCSCSSRCVFACLLFRTFVTPTHVCLLFVTLYVCSFVVHDVSSLLLTFVCCSSRCMLVRFLFMTFVYSHSRLFVVRCVVCLFGCCSWLLFSPTHVCLLFVMLYVCLFVVRDFSSLSLTHVSSCSSRCMFACLFTHVCLLFVTLCVCSFVVRDFSSLTHVCLLFVTLCVCSFVVHDFSALSLTHVCSCSSRCMLACLLFVILVHCHSRLFVVRCVVCLFVCCSWF